MTLFGAQRDQWGLRLEGYDRHKKSVWKVLGGILGFGLALNFLTLIGFAAFDGDGLTPAGWVIAGILGASVAAVFTVKRLRSRTGAEAKAVPLDESAIPAEIQVHLDKLRSLRQMYVPYAAAGDEAATEVVARLESLTDHVGELFTRLQGKADKAQRSYAQDEYDDKLGRIAAAVDRDYLLDLLINPKLWEDPR